MHRTTRVLPWSAIIVCIGAFAALTVAAVAGASETPNIVLILGDDQAYADFGFMGNRLVRTPHLDRLAARSAVFTHAYVPSSVCRPSLATLLTGLYPHQHGIHFNHPPDVANRSRADYLIRSVPTLPRLLHEAGYASLQTGKFWEGHFRNAGFDEGMTLARPAACEKPLGLRPHHGNGDAGLTIGRRSMRPIVDFVDRHAGEPMFIWYAPYLPHEPHNAPGPLVEPYADDARVPKHRVRYYANCTWLDETVGQLMAMFDRKGLSDDTLFLFVVDNGWAPQSAPRPGTDRFTVDVRTKRSPFDFGLRTPILIRWDGRIKPGRRESPVSTIDVVPTLLAAAGLGAAISGLPGEDLSAIARGQSRATDRPLFGEIYPGDATSLGRPSQHVQYRWVRSGRFKLIVPHLRDGKAWRRYVDRPALFDVVADPHERNDLSAEPRHAARIAELRRLLDAWWTPGDDSAVPNPPKSGP